MNAKKHAFKGFEAKKTFSEKWKLAIIGV